MATTHQGWTKNACPENTKDKRNHDKWAREAAGKNARDRKVARTAGEEYGKVKEDRTERQHVTYPDELMKVVDGNVRTAKVKAEARTVLDKLMDKPSTTAIGK